MELVHIDLSHLSVSPANMRHGRKAPDISDLLPSVRARGILMPLLVRPKPVPSEVEGGAEGRFEIVAGRRRYHAALALVEEGATVEPVPCAIMAAGDDASALEASLIENIARLDPDEVSQWETFSRLITEGREVAGIATTFGVTELMVKRALALGNLLPRIRGLYRQGKIDAASIRHLTLATKARQKEWLRLYADKEAYVPTGQRLKHWLFGGQSIPATAALFDLADYPAPIVADLFGEERYFSDAAAFWTLQEEAVRALRGKYLTAGWSDAVILGQGEHFQGWEHERVGKAKGGKVYISVSHQGEVEAHEGWLSRKEAKRLAKGDQPEPAKPPRPEVTANLQNYIDLHRHAAVRAVLAGEPGVTLRLMLAHAIAGSSLWHIRIEDQRAGNPDIRKSIEASPSEAAFGEKRRKALGLLGLDPETATIAGRHGGDDAAGLFPRLMKLPDQEVMAILGVVMGETLASGSAEVEAVGCHLAVAMETAWRADDAFFDLIRDREVVTAMMAEVAGPAVAQANAGEKVKARKAVIRDCLSGSNGRAKVEGWLPRWLRFPAATYTERGGPRTVAHWERLQSLSGQA